MRKTFFALLFILTLFFSSALVSGETTHNAVISYTLNGERNVAGDASPSEIGWSGTAVTIGDKDIIVTAVGRMFFTDAHPVHAFLIVDAADSSLVLSGVAVQGYDDSVDATFEYLYLEKNNYVTLLAGKTYYFCSDHIGAADKYYDSVEVVPADDISFTGTVTLNLADNSWVYTESSNINCFPIDFMYYIEGEEASPTDGASEFLESEEKSEVESAVPTEAEVSDVSSESLVSDDDPEPFKSTWLIIVIAGVVVAAVVVIVVVSIKRRK